MVLTATALVSAACGKVAADSVNIKAWIPSEVDGRKLDLQKDPSRSGLGKSLNETSGDIEKLAIGEIPGVSESFPTLFIAAMESKTNAQAIEKAFSRSQKMMSESTATIAGEKVRVLEMDLAQLGQGGGAQGQGGGAQPDGGGAQPEGSAKPPMPTITLELFSPNEDTVILVFSAESRKLADAGMKAAIESGNK